MQARSRQRLRGSIFGTLHRGGSFALRALFLSILLLIVAVLIGAAEVLLLNPTTISTWATNTGYVFVHSAFDAALIFLALSAALAMTWLIWRGVRSAKTRRFRLLLWSGTASCLFTLASVPAFAVRAWLHPWIDERWTFGSDEILVPWLCSVIRAPSDSSGDGSTWVVTHDLNLALRFADRLILLSDGAVLSQGTPQKILEGSDLEETFDATFHTGMVRSHPFAVPLDPTSHRP
jgi:hypothetical protein